MTALDDFLEAMAAAQPALRVPYYLVPPQLADAARELLGSGLADHVIVSEYLPEGTAYEYRPPPGTDWLTPPAPVPKLSR